MSALIYRLPMAAVLFEKALLCVVVLDLALGGNGYLIQFGGMRLRVILYFVCLGWVLARLTVIDRVKPGRFIWCALAAYFLITTAGAAIGYFSGFSREVLFAELKPLSYFPMLLFFVVAIRSRADVELVVSLLVVSGVTLATCYLVVLALAYLGAIDYRTIYLTLVVYDEFIFRHNPNGPFVGFLYKGAFYICVAAILLAWRTNLSSIFLTVICLAAVSLTVTRGLVLSVAICLVAAVILTRSWRRIPLIGLYVGILLGILFVAQTAERRLSINSGDFEVPVDAPWRIDADGNMRIVRNGFEEIRPVKTRRDTGDNMRLEDSRFVINNMDVQTLLIGRGIGAPIRGRERVEINYLEIIYKQGIPGISFWIAIFIYLFFRYTKVPEDAKAFALPIFLSGMFVFVVTTFNTFLTGSIGMATVFIAICSVMILSRVGKVRMGPHCPEKRADGPEVATAMQH